MCGTPQKMLEHLLETRMGIQVGPNDPFLDDFLLTHVVFMPTLILVDELRKHYYGDSDSEPDTTPEDKEYVITCKKRVVQFIQKWVIAVRNSVFDDPVAVEFIEVILITTTRYRYTVFL